MIKQTTTLTLIGILGLAAATLISCSDHKNEVQVSADPHAGHAHIETTFKPGKGVQLSELGRVSVGLETSEVTLGAQGADKVYSVQLYRRADEASVSSQNFRQGYAYASVIIPAEEAKALKLGPLDGKRTLMGIDWQLQQVTGQAEVIVEIHDPTSHFAIGDFVEISFKSDQKSMQDTVAIPAAAVLKTAKGDFAYTENQDYFFRTPIQVIGHSNGQAIIADGLFEGDVIASAGVQQLYQIELQVINGGKGCAHGH